MERLRDHIYDKENFKLYENSKKLEFVHSAFSPLFDFFTSVSCAALLLFVAYQDNMSLVQAGALFSFYQYLRRMTWPLAALGFSYMMITEGRSAFKRIRKVIEGEETDYETPSSSHLAELNDLSFSYPDDSLHLKKINIKLKMDESYLVTGLTKSGKSTLIKLFSGLQKPLSGDLKISKELLAYNPQTPFLFMNSLKENVLTNDDSSKISKSDFESVSFLKELKNLEDKEETKIGEKGTNLSGGQKQRLSLLRAIKSEKQALILDEPISAVDETTKDHIVKTLKKVSETKSLVISSSNPEHFTWMDNVILIEELAHNERKVKLIPMKEALTQNSFTSLLYKKKEDGGPIDV